MPRLWILSTALLFLALTPLSHADDKSDAKTRLQRAEALNRLDDPALKPWYLKANFSLFDDDGKLAEQGTLEEWWAGPKLFKRTITSPSYTATVLTNKEGHFRTVGTTETPYLLEMIERQIVHPIASEGEEPGAAPQMLKQDLSGPPVDCVMLGGVIPNVPFPQVGLFPTYCMGRGKDILQVSFDYGSFMAVRTALGTFESRVMPIDVSITMNRVAAVSSHLAMLKVAPLTDADFVPSAGMEPVSAERVQLLYRDIKATQIANIAPVMPPGVNPRALSYPIEIHVRLGTDGHVHWMRLSSTPDPLLATAAMAAVVHWTYAPHMVDGKAVEVETKIPVLFSKGVGQPELPGKKF